jgi:hypothetical protein
MKSWYIEHNRSADDIRANRFWNDCVLSNITYRLVPKIIPWEFTGRINKKIICRIPRGHAVSS